MLCHIDPVYKPKNFFKLVILTIHFTITMFAGDKVAIEPGIPCRMCHLCKTGTYHLCEELTFCATPPIDGNLTRYYVHDADFCFK